MRIPSAVEPAHFGLTPNTRPVRSLKGAGPTTSWRGNFASLKALGPTPFESLLEHDFQTHMSADPRIRAYAVQPHRLTYWSPDESGELVKREYTPDMAALTSSGEVAIFEVKAAHFADEPRWSRLEPYIREAYETDHHASFAVFTEHEIRAQPRLTNCEIMLRHRPPGDDPEGELTVRRLVHAGHATIGAVIAEAANLGIDDRRAFSALMRMALAGEIKFDMDRPLTDDSPIKIVG